MPFLSDTVRLRLEAWGWAPDFQARWELLEELERPPNFLPARIVAERPPGYIVADSEGRELPAELPGKWRFESASREDVPVIGDWVLIEALPNEPKAIVRVLLDRRSLLQRRAVGSMEVPQPIAANVDVALIVTSLNQDLNLRRLERYLALVASSGAEPIVVLSKSDLGVDHEDLSTIARKAKIIKLSSVTGEGLEVLEEELRPGRTFTVIGSSGVGKSTLVNRLMGREVMATQAVREDDDRGKHTTTARKLFRLPNGAILIDTPGMRELALFDAGDAVDETFDEVVRIAARCRFGDCSHGGEPGCAVAAALTAGELDPARLENWRKLSREQAYQARKLDKEVASQEKKKWKSISKQMRQLHKSRR